MKYQIRTTLTLNMKHHKYKKKKLKNATIYPNERPKYINRNIYI